MNHKQTIVFSIGLGLIAGVLGAAIILAIHIEWGGVQAGDILSFLGGIMGTGLAVAGALWIEARKRKASIVDGARPILDALVVLESKTREFFRKAGKRREEAPIMLEQMDRLNRILSVSPPRTGRQIGLFDRLQVAVAYLTSEHYLALDNTVECRMCPERTRVEDMLETFDDPLKYLIVEFSRIVDPKSSRAVKHLGEMPEP